MTRSAHENHTDDDISAMVKQEHMNMFIEHLCESYSELSIKAGENQAMDERVDSLKIEMFIKSVLVKGNSNRNLTLKAKKCYIRDRSSFELSRSSSLDKKDICSMEYTKMEAHKLLAQFPIKSANANNVTDTKTEMEVVKNCKNILTFYNNEGRACESASKDDQNQLEIFAKLCAKAYHHAGIKMSEQAVAPVASSETENRNMKQAGPVFVPPTSSVTEVPTNQSYTTNLPPLTPFWMPNGMYYGHFQDVAQPFHLPYLPMMHYIPYMHPYYQMRPFPKAIPCIRENLRMAGDGPRYYFPYPYRFIPPISRVAENNQNFSSSGNCIKPL